VDSNLRFLLVFIRQTRNVHREPFDFASFLPLSLGIGALQLMLDRGELKDWFHSSEIWIEATIAGLGFYLFTCTRSPRTSARFSTAFVEERQFRRGHPRIDPRMGVDDAGAGRRGGRAAGRPFACWCGGKT
jgi:hypothetical protein